MPKIQAFNTRRLYTVHGQRIAWTVLSTGNVAMVDIDRHIDYTLVIPGEPTNRTVLEAYDSNSYQDVRTAPWNRAEHDEAYALQKELYAAAEAAPSLSPKA